jgi:nucleoside-diphosphate-sugar epimerase
VTPTFIYRALKGQPLLLENGGRASRDFIFVEDVVDGLVRCATLGAPGEVYNLASGVETEIRKLAELIGQHVDPPARIELVDPRPWDRSGHRVGDPEKSRREIGFLARTSIDDGLARTVAWTAKHLEMIDQSINRHREHLEASTL